MNKKIFCLLLFISIRISFSGYATEPFKFAFFTDMHISDIKPQNAEDLELAVQDVNSVGDIDFVLVAGDITDLGDLKSFADTKKILDKLKMPYYITVGNHDTNYKKNGSIVFDSIFQTNKFSFEHKGYRFIGFATSPESKITKAQILSKDLSYIKLELKKEKKSKPVFLITHYPMLNGDVNNWTDLYEIIQNRNVKAILSGHYHRNVVLNYNNIPGIVNRSTLRSKENVGGYTIYRISDNLQVFEKIIGHDAQQWLTLPLN